MASRFLKKAKRVASYVAAPATAGASLLANKGFRKKVEQAVEKYPVLGLAPGGPTGIAGLKSKGVWNLRGQLAGAALGGLGIGGAASILRGTRSQDAQEPEEPRSQAARQLVRKPIKRQAGIGQLSFTGEEEELL